MQGPTHPRLHLRDRTDAHKLFEAVRLGLLPPIPRRLNDSERMAHIKSGSVFVWEQSENPMGLKRWTDDRSWSASRMREPYLFYDEKSPVMTKSNTMSELEESPYRFVAEAGAKSRRHSPTMSHYDRSASSPPSGLVKQAYSSWVIIAPDQQPRKWHITAYFTYKDLPNLPNVDQIPFLRKISIPEGMYRSGKAKYKPEPGFLEPGPVYSHEQCCWREKSVSPVRSRTPGPVSLRAQHVIVSPLVRAITPGPGTRPPSLDASLQLPPLLHGQHSQATRRAEDARMIHLLNARYVP